MEVLILDAFRKLVFCPLEKNRASRILSVLVGLVLLKLITISLVTLDILFWGFVILDLFGIGQSL